MFDFSAWFLFLEAWQVPKQQSLFIEFHINLSNNIVRVRRTEFLFSFRLLKKRSHCIECQCLRCLIFGYQFCPNWLMRTAIGCTVWNIQTHTWTPWLSPRTSTWKMVIMGLLAHQYVIYYTRTGDLTANIFNTLHTNYNLRHKYR